MVDLTKLRERRTAIYNEANAMIERSAKSGTSNTPEETEKLSALEKENEAIKATIERAERLGDTGRELNSFKPIVNPVVDLSKKEEAQYSIMRAIRAACDHKQLDGLEREVSDEITRQSGRAPKGFWFPNNLKTISRAFDTTAGAGAAQTQVTQQYIDVLRNKMILNQLGVTYLSGLIGSVSIPVKSASSTGYWVAEAGAPTASAPTMTSQVTFTPKCVGGTTDITRSLIQQTSFDAEQMVRNDIADTVAHAIDSAAFNGTGNSNQPTGLITALTPIALGGNGLALTYPLVVALETAVSAANADIGNMAYVTNSKVKGSLKTTTRASNYPSFVWENDQLNGYKAIATNAISSAYTKGTATAICSALIFGNFQDMVIGTWGATDILVDPYSLGTSGGIRIVQLQDVDIQLRRLASFAMYKDVLTA